MPTLNNRVFDNGLTVLDTEADEIHICSQEPATFAEAETTYSLGNSASLSVGAPADRTGGGREVEVGAISDGSVTANGTATHYAIIDTVNSRLLATGPLAASQVVTSGNGWTTAAFKVGIPDPA